MLESPTLAPKARLLRDRDREAWLGARGLNPDHVGQGVRLAVARPYA